MAGVRLADKQEKEVQRLVEQGHYVSVSEFIREAVREKLEGLRVIEVRDVTRDKAKQEIIEYLKAHRHTYPSDISDDLKIDYDLVLEVMAELKREGRVRWPS